MYLLFLGFRGSYRPPAPPTHGLEDNMPDVHDEADFDIPNTKAMLERFMTNMSKLADVEYQALSDLLDSDGQSSRVQTLQVIPLPNP
jgi:hypothetical protein